MNSTLAHQPHESATDAASDGITASYDSVFQSVEEALDLRLELLGRAAATSEYIDDSRFVRLAMRVAARWIDIVSLQRAFARFVYGSSLWIGLANRTQTTPEIEEALSEVATEGEGQTPLGRAVTSKYWLEAVARHICAQRQLTGDRVESLMKVHQARDESLRSAANRISLKGLVGVIVGTVGFLASQLPKETFEALGIGVAYGWYRLFTLVILLLLLLYATVAAIAWRLALRPQRLASAAMGMVLTYCEIALRETAASEKK